MRTTLDIDDPVLRDLKRLGKSEGKSLSRLASDLLAGAMASRKGRAKPPAPLRWTTRDMRARVDISDREAVLAAIDKNDV